eukprot:NODE_217_length_14216_cov_0.430545.p2 type:complete len:637 gc:universal NODE_217_length_14216_cov_0.430545:8957-7047(-)
MFALLIFGFSNWKFYQGNGLDEITDKTGFYKFKCDDTKYPVTPVIEKLHTEEYTRITISTNGTKTWVKIPSPSEDFIFGLGEQFTYWNLKGKMLRNIPREDGVGRQGLVKLLLELRTGKQELSASYIISPHFVTKSGMGLAVENKEYAEFDFRAKSYILLKVNSPVVVITLFHANNFRDHISQFTRLYGRQPIDMPKWTQNGAIIGLSGGTDRVEPIVRKLLSNNVKISAVWIEDWCGINPQKIAGITHWRVNWRWESNNKLYSPSVKQFTEKLHDINIKVLGYINPFIINSTSIYFKQAVENDYLVKFNGRFYNVDQGPGISACMINLLNAEAYKWFKELIIEELYIKAGMDGFMSDFGEYQPFETTNSTAHIEFINKWNQLNKELRISKDKLIFMRSSGLVGKSAVNLFWSGDQMSVYGKYDGLRSVLNGYLQAAISGFGLMHSDVGGLTVVALGIGGVSLGFKRTVDILIRWSEFNVFESIIRTHDTTAPLIEKQVYSSNTTIKYFKQAIDKHAALKEIRDELMMEYQANGLGLFRALYLYYPNEKPVWNIRDQFLYGPNILVAPIMQANKFERRLYLPNEAWIHIYSKKEYKQGWITIKSDYGKTPIFVRKEYYSSRKLAKLLEIVEKQASD